MVFVFIQFYHTSCAGFEIMIIKAWGRIFMKRFYEVQFFKSLLSIETAKLESILIFITTKQGN